MVSNWLGTAGGPGIQEGSASLCLTSPGIKGGHHHAQLRSILGLGSRTTKQDGCDSVSVRLLQSLHPSLFFPLDMCTCLLPGQPAIYSVFKNLPSVYQEFASQFFLFLISSVSGRSHPTVEGLISSFFLFSPWVAKQIVFFFH